MRSLACLAAALAGLSSPATVVDCQGNSYEADQLSIEAGMVTLTESGKERRLECRDIAEIAFRPVRSPAGGVRVTYTNGDTVYGALSEAVKGEAFRISSESLGPVTVRFEHTSKVEFLVNRESFRPPGDLKNFDLIQFRNPESFDRGTIVSLDDRGARFTLPGGREEEARPDDLAALHFFPMNPRPPSDPETLFAVVTLVDGSRLRGTDLRFDGSTLRFTTLYAQAREATASRLASLHFQNGRVVYLSDLTPRADENPNYIRLPRKHGGDLEFPFQRDASVKGSRLTLRGREYPRGLGVHARSILEFSLDGTFERFLATLGIDDIARGHGSASFEIEVDQKKVFDSGELTWRDAPLPVSLPLEGARSLRLIVRFGEDGNTGDCADWAMARLIRK